MRDQAPRGARSDNTDTADHGKGNGSTGRTFVDAWRGEVRAASKDELSAVEKSVAIELSFWMRWESGSSAFPGPARISGEHVVAHLDREVGAGIAGGEAVVDGHSSREVAEAWREASVECVRRDLSRTPRRTRCPGRPVGRFGVCGRNHD